MYNLVLFECVSFVLFLFVYLFVSAWSTIFSLLFFSLWSILSIHIYSCVSVWTSVFLLPSAFLFLPLLLSLYFSLSITLISLHYPSLSSGERCLTRSPWSSRVQWRESWVWWTTCPALSATSTRYPPSPASTAATRRSIITSNTTDDSPPPFHTSSGCYLSPICRAAQVITRQWTVK